MSDTSPSVVRADRLESWKRIAQHLGRSVRTVRRWEKDEHLPIHRLAHGGNGSVYAYSEELDHWLSERSIHPRPVIVERASKRLLILPLQDLSAAADQRHLCLGLADEISGYFSREGGAQLNLIARTSCQHYSINHQSVGEIGKEVAADFAIEGSLRPQNAHVRVTLNLIRVSDELIIDSLSADFPLSDPIAFEESVANATGDRFLPRLCA